MLETLDVSTAPILQKLCFCFIALLFLQLLESNMFIENASHSSCGITHFCIRATCLTKILALLRTHRYFIISVTKIQNRLMFQLEHEFVSMMRLVFKFGQIEATSPGAHKLASLRFRQDFFKEMYRFEALELLCCGRHPF